MKKNIYFLGLLLLAACANDDEPTGQQVQNTYPLTIEVTENPLIPDGEEGSHTRAAITTTSSLDEFYMSYGYSGDATYSNMKAEKSSEGKWTTTGSWPGAGDDTEVTWYASSVSLSNQSTGNAFCPNEGDPYISFSVDENAAATKDLLVAKTSGSRNGTNGNLTFNFNHACAALRFYVKKASNISSNTLSVSSVVLKHVAKQGKYYFNDGVWTPKTKEASDFTDYTLYSGDDKDITSSYTCLNGTNEDNSYLFLIPQELVGNVSTGTYVEIAWKSNYDSNATSGTARIPLPKVLVKGHKYDVKINIGNYTLTTY